MLRSLQVESSATAGPAGGSQGAAEPPACTGIACRLAQLRCLRAFGAPGLGMRRKLRAPVCAGCELSERPEAQPCNQGRKHLRRPLCLLPASPQAPTTPRCMPCTPAPSRASRMAQGRPCCPARAPTAVEQCPAQPGSLPEAGSVPSVAVAREGSRVIHWKPAAVSHSKSLAKPAQGRTQESRSRGSVGKAALGLSRRWAWEV